MKRSPSFTVTQTRNTASRNRAAGLLGRVDGVAADAGGADDRDPVAARARLAALERVRRARVDLAEAEADLEHALAVLRHLTRSDRSGQPAPMLPPGVDPAEVERFDVLHTDLVRLRRSRFRRRAQEVLALDLTERLMAERLGYVDYESFDADRRAVEPPVLDYAHLELAQHELAEAEAALAELLGRQARDGADSSPLPVWSGAETTDREPSTQPAHDLGPATDLGPVTVDGADVVGVLGVLGELEVVDGSKVRPGVDQPVGADWRPLPRRLTPSPRRAC